MNIFYLDRDPVRAAQALYDTHVVKMILESTQLLGNAYPDELYYKHTHMNHPCSVWVRQSIEHWLWLHDHALALCKEYTHRYGKEHATEHVLTLMAYNEPYFLPAHGFDDPPQCMPDQYRMLDTVDAYRKYYSHEKTHLARYTNRAAPEWLEIMV